MIRPLLGLKEGIATSEGLIGVGPDRFLDLRGLPCLLSLGCAHNTT